MCTWASQVLCLFISLHHPPSLTEKLYTELTDHIQQSSRMKKKQKKKSVRFWKTLRVRCAGTHSSIIHDSGRTFRDGISKLPPGVNVPCTLNKSRITARGSSPYVFKRWKQQLVIRYDTWTAADLLHDFERVYCVWPLEADRWRQWRMEITVCACVFVPAERTDAQKQDQCWRALRSTTKSSKSGQKKAHQERWASGRRARSEGYNNVRFFKGTVEKSGKMFFLQKHWSVPKPSELPREWITQWLL